MFCQHVTVKNSKHSWVSFFLPEVHESMGLQFSSIEQVSKIIGMMERVLLKKLKLGKLAQKEKELQAEGKRKLLL
jgi:hypothetical protein